jgi:hypothetical protein
LLLATADGCRETGSRRLEEVKMVTGRRIRQLLLVGLAVTGVTSFLPGSCEAHGRGHGRSGVRVGGFYGFAPLYGFGFGFAPYWAGYWGPYWGPYPGFYRPEGGVDMGVAMVAGWGAVDLDVKPNRAEVWVDGQYAGEARDLDGYPSYLWLEQGPHRIEVYKGGYVTSRTDVEVRRCMKTDLKLRLEKGESEPPGPRPEGNKTGGGGTKS